MAKIGNNWLWKAHKRYEGGEQADAVFPVAYRERHYCLRADRTLLRREVIGRPSPFDTGRIERHDLGWKRHAKVKQECLAEAAENLRAKGFEIEYP